MVTECKIKGEELMGQSILYYDKFQKQKWSFYIVATEEGLCYVGSQNRGIDEVESWMKKSYPHATLTQNSMKLKEYVVQLEQYVNGERKQFDFPITSDGTPFQLAVWKELQNIPYGQTRSYSEIATAINKPKAVRAVGSAIGANPLTIIVPCHRVISKSGKLSGFRGGIEMKKMLLELENNEKTI